MAGTTSQGKSQAASDLLWQAWQTGGKLPCLPAELTPADRNDRASGYAIQSLLEARSGKPVYGWKIAATSSAGQQHIAVDGPLAGRLLAEQVRPDGAVISLGNNGMCVAECEFAFAMAHDLPPQAQGYQVAQVMAAVASLHPAIEIPDSRFARFETAGQAQLIADNACAHLVIVGAKTTSNWRALNLATHAVTASVQSGTALVHHHGTGANVLKDPRLALTWLANELSGLGITLRAGQTVITGTCMTPIPVSPGDKLRASFGALGEVGASFS